MPQINILPENKRIHCDKNETILSSAKKSDVFLSQACGGKGKCSTCRVQIVDGKDNLSEPTVIEQEIASQLKFQSDFRLACQAKVSGDLTIRPLVLDNVDIDLTNLLIQDAETKFESAEKHVFIMFVDIRNFTKMVDTMLPYDVIHVLSRYYYFANSIIEKYNGHIQNFMGDGFLIIFEASRPEEEVLLPLEAGLELLTLIEKEMGPYVQNNFKKDFQIGIGLHYGLIIAGFVAGKLNRRLNVVGDTVNYASRIEKMNKKTGTNFLISEDVFNLAPDKIITGLSFEEQIRGKKGFHTLYEMKSLIDKS